MRLALIVLVTALLLTACGGGSDSYSPPPASTNGSEANLMRSERGAPIKRNKREDPIETRSRPYPG